MKYWVTTQWPHSKDEDIDEIHYGIYIPNGRESSVREMHPGDIVFIYESKTGRIENRHMLDGTIEHISRYQGKEGIVSIVRVTSDVFENVDSEPTEYTNRTTIWWRYTATTEHITSHGFISREQVNRLLGYESNYNLRGFGDMHSGIKEIARTQGEKLIQLFNNDIENEISNLILKEKNNHIRNNTYGGTGEGEMHKRIKISIQNNPELLLGEIGLKHIKTEYFFITSDRVDILLMDKFKRYVVVEVEPECINGNDIGSAQCMKYRSLMAYETNRKEYEIRAILATPIIDNDIASKSEAYDIQVKIINLDHLTTASS